MALADICRETNAGTALVAIEAWQRLGRPRWWPALTRLAREAPESFALGLHQAGVALAAGGEGGFADFVAVGLKASGSDPARRQRFFALEDPLARRVLSRGEADDFGANERHLAAFMTALWAASRFCAHFQRRQAGRRRSRQHRERRDPVPRVVSRHPRRNDRAALPGRRGARRRPSLVRRLAIETCGLKPLQVALIGLMEDARVEILAMARFPGLRRLWAPFHVARPEGGTAVALLARTARALFEPGFHDFHGFVVKARRLFDEADMTDPAPMRAIGGLIGNDLGQMRVQFNARTG